MRMLLGRSVMRGWLWLLLAALLGAGCTAKIKAARHLSRAGNYVAAGQLDRAEIEYRLVLQNQPTNLTAVRGLGTLYFEAGRYSQAFPFLQAAFSRQPTNLDLGLRLGKVYLSVGKHQDAYAKAGWILDHNPRDPEAALLLAQAAVGPTNLELAAKRVESLRRQVGDTAALETAQAILLLRAKDAPGARAHLQRALSLDPKLGSAHAAMAGYWLAQGDLTNGAIEFKKGAELSPVRSPYRLRYAEFRLMHGETEEGRKLLMAITKEAPDYLPAWQALAELALSERKYEECATLLGQVFNREPENYDGQMLRGGLELSQGHVTNAIAHFERMLPRYRLSPQVQYQLAQSYLLDGRVAKAIKPLTEAIRLDTNFAKAIILLAEVNVREGRVESAIAPLKQLIKQQPQVFQAYLVLTKAHLANKHPEEALAVFARMKEVFPRNPQVPAMTGALLRQMNRLEDARTAFNQALELAPEALDLVEQLAGLDIREKKFGAAIERAKQEQARHPAAAEPLMLQAQIYVARIRATLVQAQAKRPGATNESVLAVPGVQDDIRLAESALSQAIQVAPTLPAPYQLLAQLYMLSGRHAEALARLSALAATTNAIPALMQIASIQSQLTNYAAACEAYEKALALRPNLGLALNNLAYLYSERLGRADRALALATKARELNPQSPVAADTLGWMLYKKGDYAQALRLLSEAAEQLPGEPELQFHLGMNHYMLGEIIPARLALQHAAESDREFPGKEEARRRLSLVSIDPDKVETGALAALEERLRREPSDPIVVKLLAAVQERRGINKPLEPAFDSRPTTYLPDRPGGQLP